MYKQQNMYKNVINLKNKKNKKESEIKYYKKLEIQHIFKII